MKEKTANELLEKVKETYNQIANEFSDTRNRAWPEFELILPYLKQEKTLVDLGCGNGRLLDFIEKKLEAEFKIKYLGIDNSESLLQNAKRLHPEAMFIPGDQLNIPIADNHADIVCDIAAFHHIPSHTMRMNALLEMKRVMKKDGKLIITVWMLWQKKYLKFFYKALIRSIITLGDFSPKDFLLNWKNKKEIRYYHAFTMSELVRLINKSDLKIIKKQKSKFTYTIIATK
jgi:ubiquinone/menaquinone biosynthesis C-methylase UbiE